MPKVTIKPSEIPGVINFMLGKASQLHFRTKTVGYKSNTASGSSLKCFGTNISCSPLQSFETIYDIAKTSNLIP